jgi:hypothetical protein
METVVSKYFFTEAAGPKWKGCGGKNAENRNNEEGKNDKNDFWIVKLNLKKLN